MTAKTVVTLVGRSHGRPQQSTTIQGHLPSGIGGKHDYQDRHPTQNGPELPPRTLTPPGWVLSRVIQPASREEWATLQFLCLFSPALADRSIAAVDICGFREACVRV